MLAAHFPQGSDIHIYFENDEIEMLTNEKIEGLFFESIPTYPHAPLEVSSQNKVFEGVETKMDKLPDGKLLSVKIKIATSYCEVFKERRFYEFHLGYRHVTLLDIENLDFNYQFNYMKLKTLESKLKRRPAPSSEYFMELFAKAITNKHKK